MTSTRPTPGPDVSRAQRRRPRRSPGRTIILGAFGLLDGLLLWPWGLLGILLAGLAVYEGWQLRRVRAGRAALGIALAGLVVALLGTGVGFVIRGDIARYSDCQAGANTNEAQQVCQRQLDQNLHDRFGITIPAV